MEKKPLAGWTKHGDFIVLDIICLQLSCLLMHWILAGIDNPFTANRYLFMAIVLLAAQIIVMACTHAYKGITRRIVSDEAIAVFRFSLNTVVVALLLLFLLKEVPLSRLHLAGTILMYMPISLTARTGNKTRIFRRRPQMGDSYGRSIVLVTAGRLVDGAMKKLQSPELYRNYFISKIVVSDGDMASVRGDYNAPVCPMGDRALRDIQADWVDEVFILQSDDEKMDTELMNRLIDMGITVHIAPEILNDDSWPKVALGKIGKFRVLTSSTKFVYTEQIVVKRAMDILGGIIGCILTGLLALFIGPAIYVKSPGPIFFTQDRIGRNGRTFKMYKFRSMYMDAEDRRKALIEENNMNDAMMFKLEDDPRIIGSEKKDRKGRPKGIGNFIRDTSIDEFPQFWNVLKGDMSLVGTRPPLPEEWDRYDPHHRARMTIKPGITGLWQVSGRSEITDFEEVVRLDKEYINSWSITLDIRILLKTVKAVIIRQGAR